MLTQLAVLKKPRLLLVHAMATLGYGGSFIAFAYLAPIPQEVSGFASSSVGLVMLVCGARQVAGAGHRAGLGTVAFGNVPGLQIHAV